jgi:galactosylxylosylprotein 3-beta-galactosyltransferase
MLLKFAIGTIPAEHEAAIAQEEKACGTFLQIPSDEVRCGGMPGPRTGPYLEARELQSGAGKAADEWLCLQDTYQRLTFKTVAFWRAVSSQYSVKYVVKVDDDSYVRLDRLTIALGQWAEMGSGKSAAICQAIAYAPLQACWW